MPERSFLGGLRITKFNLIWPFGGLALSDDGMTVRFVGRVFTRRDWSGVSSVERVVGGLMGIPGVRIRLVDGDEVVFWAFSAEPILAAFREHGVQVVESEGPPPKARGGEGWPPWIGWLGQG
jgi:hypothetical protein